MKMGKKKYLDKEVKQEIEERIRRGDRYTEIAKDTGVNVWYIRKIAYCFLKYDEVPAQQKANIITEIKSGAGIVELQAKYKMAREQIKEIIQEYEKENGIIRGSQQKKEAQKKQEVSRWEHVIEEALQSPEAFQCLYEELKEKAKQEDYRELTGIATLLLERGELYKSEKLVKLGIQMKGREPNGKLEKLQEKIMEYNIRMKILQWNDIEKVAKYTGLPIKKVKQLASKVRLNDSMLGLGKGIETEENGDRKVEVQEEAERKMEEEEEVQEEAERKMEEEEEVQEEAEGKTEEEEEVQEEAEEKMEEEEEVQEEAEGKTEEEEEVQEEAEGKTEEEEEVQEEAEEKEQITEIKGEEEVGVKQTQKGKSPLEELISELMQSPAMFQQVYKELEKRQDVKKIRVIATILLEKGELTKSEKLVKLGIRTMGREMATQFVELEKQINGYKIGIKWKQWKDWEKVANYMGMPVKQAKELYQAVESKETDSQKELATDETDMTERE